MKFAIVIPSGLLDLPSPAHGDRTPLEVAKMPCLQSLAATGRLGQAVMGSSEFHALPDEGLQSVLGYAPQEGPSGAAALFAADLKISLTNDDQPLLCEFVTVRDGLLVDDRAGYISPRECASLLSALRAALPVDFELHAGPAQQHLLIWKAAGSLANLSAEPAESFLGKPFQGAAPRGKGSRTLAKLMRQAEKILSDHDVNQVRADLGENPANAIAISGPGPLPRRPAFKDRFGVRGGLVSRWPLARGWARAIGWSAAAPGDAPDSVESDLRMHAAATLEMLDRTDLACVHLNLPELAGAHLSFERKCEMLQQLDACVLTPLAQRLSAAAHWRLLLIPERFAPAALFAPRSSRTAFLMAGSDVPAGRSRQFSETAAADGEMQLIHGWELMEYFLRP